MIDVITALNKVRYWQFINKTKMKLTNTEKRKLSSKFYLGTCYSEMKRRVNNYNPNRPKYYGMSLCSKEDFIRKFEYDVFFLTQYKLWQDNNFKRSFAPSIDRIDNSRGYDIDNIDFKSNYENWVKDWKVPVKAFSFGSLFGEYTSVREAAQATGVSEDYIPTLTRTGKQTRKGFSFEKL